MAGIQKVVDITVKASAPGVTAPGFGVPLILSQNATFASRTKLYTKAADVVADFGAGSPEAAAANAMFSQSPAIKRLRIGRASTNPVTQRWNVAVELAGVVGKSYRLRVWKADGTWQEVSYETSVTSSYGFAVSAQYPTIYIALDSFQCTWAIKTNEGATQTWTFGGNAGWLSGVGGTFGGVNAGSFVVRADEDPTTDQIINVSHLDNTFDKVLTKLNLQAQGFGATDVGGGQLYLQSRRFGTASNVRIVSGDALVLAELGLAIGLGTPGLAQCTKSGGTGMKSVSIPFFDAATPLQIVVAIALADGVSAGSLFVNPQGRLQLQSNTLGLAPAGVQVLGSSTAKLGFDTAEHNGEASGGADNDSIIAGLKALIDALVDGPAITTSIIGAGGSHTLRAVANASTGWFAIEIADPTLLVCAQDHAAPTGDGLTTDLNAIVKSTSDFYGLITLYNSPAYILAAASVIEGLGPTAPKLYTPDTADTVCAIVTDDVATDVLHTIKAQGRTRTGGAFHARAAEWFAACQMSRFFTIDPGKDNWRLKNLSGPTTGWANGDELDSDQTDILDSKNANYFDTIGGDAVVDGKGKVGGGPFIYIDIQRGIDWFVAQVGTDTYNLLKASDKVGMSDAGITKVDNVLRADLQKGIDADLVNPGSPPNIPVPVVTVPRAGDVDPALRTQRTLPDCSITFVFTGAIDLILITVNVTQ